MEALLLYFVLFFPSLSGGAGISVADIIPFSITRELVRTFTYTIPSFALLWYLISGKNGFSALVSEKPGSRDFIPLVFGFSGLVIIGFGISFLVTFFSGFFGFSLPPKIAAPDNIRGWIVIFLSCFGTGYLEESYFRYYLLKKLEFQLPFPALRIAFSTILFAVCHFYEGPWGIINAVLAGVLLSILFIRYRSLHSIAWAHGAYNMLVYIMGNIS